jgi:ATP synthase protein I
VSDVGVRDRRDSRDTRDSSAEAEGRALGLNVGWTVLSYLLSGMAAYGAIGWLVGRAVHISILFPIGMLVGLAISLGFVIWRYGRNAAAGTDMKTGMSATASRRASHRRGLPREEKSR